MNLEELVKQAVQLRDTVQTAIAAVAGEKPHLLNTLGHIGQAVRNLEGHAVAAKMAAGESKAPESPAKSLSVLLLLCSILWLLSPHRASAQVSQFAQPTYLTVTTNSPALVTTPATITVPPIQLTFSGATNANTTVTNTIVTYVAFTNTVTFVYNAALMGTNFTTNWPQQNYLVTNLTYGQASPQSGGSNTCSLK